MCVVVSYAYSLLYEMVMLFILFVICSYRGCIISYGCLNCLISLYIIYSYRSVCWDVIDITYSFIVLNLYTGSFICWYASYHGIVLRFGRYVLYSLVDISLPSDTSFTHSFYFIHTDSMF
uniref:Uncharacterized protein n=1 Tax=Cacopsylla melanoneura TaxID=428564 RepID=A0A8D8RAF3_9HEMI